MDQFAGNTNSKPSFIVIDDDPLNNKVCGMFIQRIMDDAQITTFIDPNEGIAYVRSLPEAPGNSDVILFLDINMPGVDGWQVVDAFKSVYTHETVPVKIFMLSSSVNPQDSQKAQDPFVCGYIEKPLSIAKLKAVLAGHY
jgi:CheY-like chemotaxis protein